MRILFAGGGTAGHINPALAIAGEFKARHNDAEIFYIGTKDKLEAKLVPEKGYEFYTIEVAGFQRKPTPKNLVRNVVAVKKAITASLRCKKLLKEINPDLVVGTGGYVSGPVLKQAQKLGFKTAIHEQNAFPGVTTKLLCGGADIVMLAMPEAEKHLKLNKKPLITGNPIRSELLNITKEEAKKKLGFDTRPVILSFGGSLGAKKINQTATDLIKWHNGSEKYYHIHGTGKGDNKAVLEALNGVKLSNMIDVREYINDMEVCMAAADLVICRAGAITLSELLALGKPSILVPSPYVAENHQYHNALTLKNAGAAEIIEEKDLTSQYLIETVESLINDKGLLDKMSVAANNAAITDANERIYNALIGLLSK